MSSTVRNIIVEALNRANIVSRRQSAPADMVENSLRLLKGVAAKFSNDNLLQFLRREIEFTPAGPVTVIGESSNGTTVDVEAPGLQDVKTGSNLIGALYEPKKNYSLFRGPASTSKINQAISPHKARTPPTKDHTASVLSNRLLNTSQNEASVAKTSIAGVKSRNRRKMQPVGFKKICHTNAHTKPTAKAITSTPNTTAAAKTIFSIKSLTQNIH